MTYLRMNFCRHDLVFVRNFYGDEINARGGKRSLWRCRHCGKYIAQDRLVGTPA